MSRALPARRDFLLQLTQLTGAAALAACGGGNGGDAPAPAGDPAWRGFGRDAQHSALGAIASQDLNRILWSTPVDLAPQYRPNGALLIHYGSPVITGRNTVIVPVKTTAAGGFRVEARAGGDGALIWSQATDYVPPQAGWTPSYNPLLTAQGRLVMPGAGGKLLLRDDADAPLAEVGRGVFYGAARYAADPAAFDSAVFINTPVTADAQGNQFFGFAVTGPNPAGLVGGVARLGTDGQGRWISAAAAAGDAAVAKPAMNSAPALSPDGQTLYVAVNTAAVSGTVQTGWLLALDSTTLAVKARAALLDPDSGAPARINDNGTASPAVAPDGRVFFGVQEPAFGAHNGRGWLLQFDAQLGSAGAPGSFGWDVTPSIIPAGMVPSYGGSSAWLLATKYNNYVGDGWGDGRNRIAVLDPNTRQPDAYSGQPVMREVLTQLGPTFESGSAGPVKEWCINTMAADPRRRAILVNNEDGRLYRWDLATNTLDQGIRLADGPGQAYTPTAIGADGAVYAISNARLFAVGR